MNQLLSKDLLNNTIKFEDISSKDFVVAFEVLLPEVRAEFEDELKMELTYENLFEKGFKGRQLSKVLSYLSHLSGVVNNDELRDVYGKYVPQISAMYQEMGLDKRIYDRIIRYQQTDEYKTLNDLRKKMIENIVIDFKLGGIDLEDDKKKRMQEISFRLSELSDQFENNLMDVRNQFEMQVDISELAGLPERSLNNVEKLENGKVLIKDSTGLYDDILVHCDVENTRKKIYEERLLLGVKEGFDNKPLLREILKLKKELAQILGYKNYAESALVKNMLKKPQEVLDFINNLANKSLEQAVKESEQVNEYGFGLLGRKVDFHDRAYVIEHMQKDLYAVDSEQIRKYFPVDKVLSGLFEIVENLYGISFVENITQSKWHNDVKVYDLYDEKEEHIGLVYFDLFKRKNKESGAWMMDQQSKVDTEFENKKSITYLVLNISKDEKGVSTVEFDEIVTLFHEMGHGLHNMLTEVKESYFSGLSNVEHDAIELPSQFMENFAWDYDVLKNLSLHIETGEKLPLDMFERLQKMKYFLSANQMVRQSVFARLDMYIHTENIDPMMAEIEIKNQWKTRDLDPRSEFLPSFSHIFSGGYAAGYYAYKWSEVLSADAFAALKQSGSSYLQQKEMANHFRKCILAKGGTQDMAKNFVDFRGRVPDVNFLLIDNGIIDGNDYIKKYIKPNK